MQSKSSYEVECSYYLLSLLIPFKVKVRCGGSPHESMLRLFAQGLNALLVKKFFADAMRVLDRSSAPTGVRCSALLFLEACIMVGALVCY